MLSRILHVWKRTTSAAYAGGVGIARGGRRTPPAAAPDLSGHFGLWVAVDDGVVVAAADTPRKLVHELSKLSEDVRRDAVMQKAHKPSADIIIGLG